MKKVVVLNLIVLFFVGGLYTNCSSGSSQGVQSSSSTANSLLSWNNGIRDIFEARCTLCHSAGGGLPIWTDKESGVDGYADVVAFQSEIFLRVVTMSEGDSGSMPLFNETNMTPAERKKVEAWVRAGLNR